MKAEKYTVGLHHSSGNYAVDGPVWGPHTVFGFYSSIMFKTRKEAEVAAKIANAAYYAGKQDFKKQLNELIKL